MKPAESGTAEGGDLAPRPFQWPYTLSPYDTGMAIEDAWPTLFFGEERMDEIRRKADRLLWAAQAVEKMAREAEVVIEEAPLLPEERIGWRHEFYSHTTAEHLLYDPGSPDRFLDPLDQTFHDSPDQHRAWVLLTHERTLRLMRSLGVLYGLTGDDRYARWVGDGMRIACRLFPRKDLREGNQNGALYFHPLYDSQSLMLLANAYSLTRTSPVYSAADHVAVARDIFEAGVPSQIAYLDEVSTHNIACYVAVSLAVVGEVAGRDDWQARGLGHPDTGVPAMLREGLRTDSKGRVDGFWFEGTMFYHFYTMAPVVAAFEILLRDGKADADVEHRFERLFSAPVRMCDAHLRLPCLGDLGAPGARSLAVYRHLYEYAAGQLDADTYGRVLTEIYATGVPRDSLAALAYGPDDLPGGRIAQRSTVLTAAGIGVFRGKADREPFYLLFRSGRHGGGHDHLDKLSVDLRAMGEIIAPDLGTSGYALKDIRAYYHSTLSHNTLMVDEKDQARVNRAELRFRSRNPQQAVGAIEDAYEGVRLERRIRFSPPIVGLEDRCTSRISHRYGWIFHARGAMVLQPVEPCEPLDLPPLPIDGPFAWFTDRRTYSTREAVCVDWRVAERVWLRLLVSSDGPLEITVGRTPGNPIPDRHGALFLRGEGRERVFRASLEVHRGVPATGRNDSGPLEP